MSTNEEEDEKHLNPGIGPGKDKSFDDDDSSKTPAIGIGFGKGTKFSKTSSEWVSAGKVRDYGIGKATAADILQEACESRNEEAPTEEEIAVFEKDLKKTATENYQSISKMVERLLNTADLAGLSQKKIFDAIQPLPEITVPPYIPNPTVSAVHSMQDNLGSNQRLSNAILERLTGNVTEVKDSIDRSGKQQNKWNKKIFVVALLTLAAAIVAAIASFQGGGLPSQQQHGPTNTSVKVAPSMLSTAPPSSLKPTIP